MLGAALSIGFSQKSNALSDDALIEGARQCTQHFARQERIHGIPSHVLAAISSTESGRWNDTLGMVLPWPWTINAEGKGYYFDSKALALRKVRQLQGQGMKSIDIGCMQVNLKHHPYAFANLERAFDPKTNVAYAASYLRSHYDEMKNWNKAIAAYHSKTPKYGDKYLARVEKSWNAITGKVRVARAEAADSPIRRPKVSHRVIKVRDTQSGAEAQSARQASKASQLFAKPKTSDKSFMNLDKPKMMRIRDVDRLNSGFGLRKTVPRSTTSLRRIRVSDALSRKGKSSMLVRTNRVSDKPVLLSANTTAAIDSAALQAQKLFVSNHSAKAASSKSTISKTTPNAAKPKFIFVD